MMVTMSPSFLSPDLPAGQVQVFLLISIFEQSFLAQGTRGGSAIGSPQAELTTPQMQQRLTAARKTPSLMHNLDTRLKDVRQSSKWVSLSPETRPSVAVMESLHRSKYSQYNSFIPETSWQ